MVNFKKILVALLLVAGCNAVSAHDFTVTLNGQKIYFNITSKYNRTAEVTYKGNIADNNYSDVKGVIEIPAKVKHDGVVYSVTNVSPKAFSNATELEGVIFPSGVKSIGDFAFEGCTSLKTVVFPGNKVTFGQGVFFKCTAITDVTLGSDWDSVNFEMFRWSENLKVIAVPAKVEKISQLKSLKHLTAIHVDVNNKNFASVDGVLYSKDKRTLYGCPRAFAGKLAIADGTETVTVGAFADCPGITSIDVPASVVSLSFRETSRLNALQTVIFRGLTPMSTAFADGKGLLLLQVANPDVKIVVPKDSKKLYQEALVQKQGEFREKDDVKSIPYMVRVDQMPKAKNLTGVKSFDKY